METASPPRPAIDLFTPLYYQLVYTLTALLPPPLDDTQEGLSARNHAAIAKVAALLPVNANELDLAAQCIAARAQAEEMLRLLRQYAGDVLLVMRLNAQYASMLRTSLSVHARLMKVQALRQKREAIEGAANQDAWTQHVAERCMLVVTDPDAKPPGKPLEVRAQTNPKQAGAARASEDSSAGQAAKVGLEAARPKVAPVATPVATPVPDQRVADNISENETNSQDLAFETWLSTQLPNLVSRGSGETDLRALAREAITGSRLAARQSLANGSRESREGELRPP
jgi:hypothetical protein